MKIEVDVAFFGELALLSEKRMGCGADSIYPRRLNSCLTLNSYPFAQEVVSIDRQQAFRR